MKPIRLDRQYTDILKIFSAFCVVVGHYASFTIVNQWSESRLWCIIASQAGYIGVALFFFLSGYGLMESEQKRHLDFKDFVKKRFLKIYKPVLLVTVLWVLFEIVFLHKELSRNLIYTILWGFDDCVLWFIKILMGLYLCFFFFSQLRRKGKSAIGLVVLTIGTVVLMIVANNTEGYSSIGIPCFMIGVVVSLTKDVKTAIGILMVAFAAGVVYSMITKDNHGYHAAFDYMLILFLTLFPLLVNLHIGNRTSDSLKNGLAYCSLLTFDVYLVHYKLLDGVTQLSGGGTLTLCRTSRVPYC